MKPGTAATLALLMLLLAGCGNPNPPEPTSTPSSSTTTTAEPAATLQTVEGRDRTFIRIGERPANATLRVFHTAEQEADTLDGCGPGGPGVGRNSGREWYSFTVWNRTGLVHYEEHPIWPKQKRFDHSVQLPPDPPFLVWVEGTCLGSVSIQFSTPDWKRFPLGGGGPEPGAIDESYEPTVEIRIPAGQLEGNGYFRVEGNTYHIEANTISGEWTFEGQSFGDVYTHAPDQTNGDWYIHSWFDLTDSGWEETHGDIAMPGTYRYHVVLDAPTVVETVWTGRMWAMRFLPSELELNGFQVPFRLYDDHTA
ncbi:MAG: hypothetical protein QOD77_232 [Thermoplasmata archaeon]|jgi:hypothetical protein|nr:hypothetical protein [Thermoplasmata archaeon]